MIKIETSVRGEANPTRNREGPNIETYGGEPPNNLRNRGGSPRRRKATTGDGEPLSLSIEFTTSFTSFFFPVEWRNYRNLKK